jgi:hypothetical protein
VWIVVRVVGVGKYQDGILNLGSLGRKSLHPTLHVLSKVTDSVANKG